MEPALWLTMIPFWMVTGLQRKQLRRLDIDAQTSGLDGARPV